MAKKKSPDKLDQNLKEAATKIGKALARSQVKFEKTRRQALKRAEEMVERVTHSAEKPMGQKVDDAGEAEERIKGTRKGSSSRFKPTGRKSVTDSIGLLADEVQAYLEENEEIGLSKLVNIMKNRSNSEAMTFGAIGWLARDGKITISRDGKKISIH